MSKAMSKGKKVVLSGMRTTGPVHLGHLVGALDPWIEVQNSGEYICYFLPADVQALTTHAKNPELLAQSVREMVLSWMSVGLDPSLPHVHFVLQSQVPERHELSVLLGMVTLYSEVMGNPTLKAELEAQDAATMGFMYYPVDQCADISMVDPMVEGGAILVPTGDDQSPHLELHRKVIRRLNRLYGTHLTPCSGLVGPVGRLVGTDGDSKMSKSMGNTIDLTATDEEIDRAVSRMPIDPARAVHGIRHPGNPNLCVALVYHRDLNPDRDAVAQMEDLYRAGNIGDAEIKDELKLVIRERLAPIRERRAAIEHVDIGEILFDGTHQARQACIPVVEAVRDAMHLSFH